MNRAKPSEIFYEWIDPITALTVGSVMMNLAQAGTRISNILNIAGAGITFVGALVVAFVGLSSAKHGRFTYLGYSLAIASVSTWAMHTQGASPVGAIFDGILAICLCCLALVSHLHQERI